MILIANWKMYLSHADALALAKEVVDFNIPKGLEVVLCPSATALAAVKEIVGKKVSLGSQNAFWHEEGAYTGEISCTRLKELGCSYVLLGHSERRQYLDEKNTMIRQKMHASVATEIQPILCVGENATLRKKGMTVEYVTRQIEAALEGIEPTTELIIAYEPIWAIGTGDACKPTDAKAMRDEIETVMKRLKWKKYLVLYGGSVDEKNVVDYVKGAGFDGVLVGGASTKKESLKAMIDALLQ